MRTRQSLPSKEEKAPFPIIPSRDTMREHAETQAVDGEGFEPPVFNSILRFSRPTLSTAQTSIPFALRPPCTLAGSSLCDSLRLLAPPIGGLYCLTERERVVVRIATLRVYIYIYDNMHLLLSFMPYRTESSFSQDHFTRPQPLKRARRTYSLGGSIPLQKESYLVRNKVTEQG